SVTMGVQPESGFLLENTPLPREEVICDMPQPATATESSAAARPAAALHFRVKGSPNMRPIFPRAWQRHIPFSDPVPISDIQIEPRLIELGSPVTYRSEAASNLAAQKCSRKQVGFELGRIETDFGMGFRHQR